MNRILQLDGLRALAILLVMLRHYAGMPYGWAGVDLFFVLSGFLITGILRRDRLREDYWRAFYIKRAARILPIMAVTMLLGIALFPVPIRHLYPYYALLSANVASMRYPGQVYSLSVLWSLAVEEQFYIFWPLAVRYLNRRKLITLLAVILIAEPVLRGLATPHFSSFGPIYYLTPFRLDGLAAGSLLALLEEREHTWIQAYSGPLCFALLTAFAFLSLIPGFNRDANTAWFNSLGYSLLGAVSALAVAHLVTRPQSFVSRSFAWRPAVYVGSISYGVYLIHPLLAPWAHRVSGKLACSLLAIGLASLSFRFFESPIIRWGKNLARQPAVGVEAPTNSLTIEALN